MADQGRVEGLPWGSPSPILPAHVILPELPATVGGGTRPGRGSSHKFYHIVKGKCCIHG
jgi:hypothetical protein